MRGFSLLELIISLSIFSILTTIFIANFRGGEQQRVLEFSSQNIVGVLEKARVWAVSGKTKDSSIPSGGYGVRISKCIEPPCDVTLFEDKDGDGKLDYSDEEEMEGDSYILPLDIIIENVSTSGDMDVVFKGPRPLICVNRECPSSSDPEITLKNIRNSSIKKIVINQRTGQIIIK